MMQGMQSNKAGTRQQAHDEGRRTRRMQEPMERGEGRNRFEMDDQMGHSKRPRVEASANDEPMSEECGEGQTDQGASSSRKRRDDGAAHGRSGKWERTSRCKQLFFSPDGSRQRRRSGSASSGSMHVEQPELADLSTRKYIGSPSGSKEAEHVETKHAGGDVAAIENKEAVVEGEQAHTMFVTSGSTPADSKEHQNRKP